MMSVDLSTCTMQKQSAFYGGSNSFQFFVDWIESFWSMQYMLYQCQALLNSNQSKYKHTILQNSTNSKFVQHQMEWISCYLHFPSRESTKTEEGIFLPSLHAWMMVSAWNYGTYISGEQRQNFIRGESRGKTLVVLPKNLKVPICCGFLCGF